MIKKKQKIKPVLGGCQGTSKTLLQALFSATIVLNFSTYYNPTHAENAIPLVFYFPLNTGCEQTPKPYVVISTEGKMTERSEAIFL